MVTVRDKNPDCLILRKYMTVRNKTKMFSYQPTTFHHFWFSFWILRKTVTTYRNAKKKKTVAKLQEHMDTFVLRFTLLHCGTLQFASEITFC